MRLVLPWNINYCFKLKIYSKNHKQQLINEYTPCRDHKAATGMEPLHFLENNSMHISVVWKTVQCGNAEPDSWACELTQYLIQGFSSITFLLNNLCEPLQDRTCSFIFTSSTSFPLYATYCFCICVNFFLMNSKYVDEESK